MRLRQLVLITVLCMAIGILVGCGTNSKTTGVVVQKVFTPATTGTGISSSGKLVVTSTSETHTLAIQLADGELVEQEVSKEFYYKVKEGDTLDVEVNNVWGVIDVQEKK